MNAKLLKTYALIVFSLTLASFLLFYLSSNKLHNPLFNSDALYLPTLFADLFKNEGHISDWHLTPAPYYFPDYPIYLLSYLLGSTPYAQIALFALFQITLTFLALLFLFRQTMRSPGHIEAATATALLVWLGFNAGHTFQIFFVSAHHYGCFLVSLLLIGLWFKHQRTSSPRPRRYTLFALCLIAFSTTLSDNLFLVNTVAPLLAVSLLFALMGGLSEIKKRFLPIALVSLSSWLGVYLYPLLVPNKDKIHSTLNFVENKKRFIETLSRFTDAVLLNNTYAIIFALCITSIIVLLVRQNSSAERESGQALRWLLSFFVISTLALIVANTLTSDHIAMRYMITSLMWPPVLGTLFVSYLFGRFSFAPLSLAAAVVVFSLGLTSLESKNTNGIRYDFYPPDIACVDRHLQEHKLDNGIAQYWDAKQTQILSKLNLNIGQYSHTINLRRWITSERFYKEKYDFAIITGAGKSNRTLSRSMLERMNGEPSHVYSCHGKTLLVYGKDRLQTTKFMEPGNAFTWGACELPLSNAKEGAECVAIKKDMSRGGVVTYGPYEQLPQGWYEWRILYASAQSKDTEIGGWDIGHALPDRLEQYARGPIMGSGEDGAPGEVSGLFEVSEALQEYAFELRTHADAHQPLTVIALELRMLEPPSTAGIE